MTHGGAAPPEAERVEQGMSDLLSQAFDMEESTQDWLI